MEGSVEDCAGSVNSVKLDAASLATPIGGGNEANNDHDNTFKTLKNNFTF